MTQVSDIGERELISRLSRFLPDDASLVCGAGDDCAVVRSLAHGEHDLLLTSDAVIADRHFTATASPHYIGHKAITRCLSDLAAMGGEARWALINIVVPADTDATLLDDIYRGAAETAATYGLLICGGDTAQGSSLSLNVFAVGSLPRDGAVRRSGARAGDALFVTGTLGGQYQAETSPVEPRLGEGQWLRDWANAMIDLSDGLATDVRHLADASKVGFTLNGLAIPISTEAKALNDDRSLLDHALTDGEDYELLFTIPGERVEAFVREWKHVHTLPCTHIGSATDRTGMIELETEGNRSIELKATGYDHFE